MTEQTTPQTHSCSSAYETDADGLSHWTEAHADAWIGLLETHKQLTRALDAELSSKHGLSLSRVSRIIDALEERGLVARRACPSDARVVHAKLAAAGLALVRSAQAPHFASVQAAFFDRLDEAEVATLARVFGRFAPRAADACDAGG
ncbi:MAG TPA: MarR family transcriptional regulator [Solirubrobacteraceae bacterium]|nr:MarR family transcriptional regulator [Solirubrobacteraceae bacterium]